MNNATTNQTETSTMTTAINWTTAAGAAISMTLSVEYGIDSQGSRKTGGRRHVEIAATVDGVEENAQMIRTITHHAQYVAAFGRIGMDAEQYNKFRAIHARLADSLAAHNQSIDDHADAMDAVSARTRRIEIAMAYGE